MEKAGWTFLTNHGHLFLCLASEPNLRVRELAQRIGITERAVQKIIADLVEWDYLEKERQGRRNSYQVVWGKHLRHPVEGHRTVDDLVSMVYGEKEMQKLRLSAEE